jgi:hypothetical protein
MMGEVKDDNDIHSPSAWKRDLLAAGWKEERVMVWKDPEGNLWRGPYGAWRELQRRKGGNDEQ